MPNLIGGIVLGYIWSMIFDGVLSRYGTSILMETKYGFWGLMVFVAIPLPMTGAWTGAVAAWLLGIEKHKALLAIVLGIIIASGIVTGVLLGGSSVGSIFIKRV